MEEVTREGVDLMIAIDLSNSMMAEDIKPNRLERSKQAISRLIDKLKGQKLYSHVTLRKGERSDLANLANELL